MAYGIQQIFEDKETAQTIKGLYVTHSMGFSSEFPMDPHSNFGSRDCSHTMAILREDSKAYGILIDRLEELKLNPLMQFHYSGDDALAFHVYNPDPRYDFVVKLSSSSAFATLEGMNASGVWTNVPQVVKPDYYELIDDKITLTIMPYLTRDNLTENEKIVYMSALSSALGQLNYRITDGGVQNVMLFPHDKTKTPFLMDYDSVDLIPGRAANSIADYNITIHTKADKEKAIQWRGKQRILNPVLEIEDPLKRVSTLVERAQCAIEYLHKSENNIPLTESSPFTARIEKKSIHPTQIHILTGQNSLPFP